LIEGKTSDVSQTTVEGLKSDDKNEGTDFRFSKYKIETEE